METVLLVIHIFIVLALIVVVLMQRSEGGALGMGGGGGGGGFLTGRGTANLLTRTTAILALCFFVTSIASTIIAKRQGVGGSVFDAIGKPKVEESATAPGSETKTPGSESGNGILDDLQRGRGPLPTVPGGR